MPWAQKHVQSDTGMTARQLRTGMGWMCANVHIDKTENGIKRRQSPFQLGFGGGLQLMKLVTVITRS